MSGRQPLTSASSHIGALGAVLFNGPYLKGGGVVVKGVVGATMGGAPGAGGPGGGLGM